MKERKSKGNQKPQTWEIIKQSMNLSILWTFEII